MKYCCNGASNMQSLKAVVFSSEYGVGTTALGKKCPSKRLHITKCVLDRNTGSYFTLHLFLSLLIIAESAVLPAVIQCKRPAFL